MKEAQTIVTEQGIELQEAVDIIQKEAYKVQVLEWNNDETKQVVADLIKKDKLEKEGINDGIHELAGCVEE